MYAHGSGAVVRHRFATLSADALVPAAWRQHYVATVENHLENHCAAMAAVRHGSLSPWEVLLVGRAERWPSRSAPARLPP